MTDSGPISVAIIMGSKSDWESMEPASEILAEFEIPHECRVLSAHRTPAELRDYIKDAEARGCEVFIGGAGGAAALPGVIAAETLRPVLGVPVARTLQGLDSLLSIAQMPGGIPVGTMAVGRAGATNAALMAAAILGTADPGHRGRIEQYRAKRARKILDETLPSKRSRMGFKP